MILSDFIAVVWKYPGDDTRAANYDLYTPSQWDDLQKDAREGRAVILEAWTMGKCVSGGDL